MNFATFGAVLAMGALAWASGPDTAPPNKTAPAKKPVPAVVHSASPTTAHKPTTPLVHKVSTGYTARSTAIRKPVTTTTATVKRSVKKAPVAHTSWRNRQAAPTADRYREIQDALVARGYLSAEDATGSWGANSTAALKRFQADQTLDSTGRIDSLSLIALGLGPRHDSTAPRAADGNLQSEFGRN